MSVAMQVSVEKTGQHERKLTVSIPAERLDSEVAKRLQQLSKTVRLAGFRKGKVPLSVVTKQFGDDARAEVVGKLVESSLSDAIRQEKLVPASRPEVEINKDEAGAGLEYYAVFEVYPEIVLKGLDALVIDKPKALVNDADINETLDRIRKQHMVWSASTRPAQEGDRVGVDMKGTLVGSEEPFTEAKDMKVKIGASEMIPGFEDHFKGATLEQAIAFDITFPEDYYSPDLAGKLARFETTVTSVEAGELPELNDAFAEKLGLKEGGLEELKKRIKDGLQGECNQALNTYLKEQLLKLLLKHNEVDVPQSLVDTELRILTQNPEAAALEEGLSIEENAKRRVTLSLLLGQYIKDNGLTLDHARVQKTIRDMAMTYPNPEAVMKWFYQDQQRLSGVASMVLEDQAVEQILSGVQDSEETLSYKEMLEKASKK